MYQIVTIQPDDTYVVEVIATIVGTSQQQIPSPTAGYAIITNQSVELVGTDPSQDFLIVIGHDTQAGFSDALDWNAFQTQLQQAPYDGAANVFVIAPSAESTTGLFGYGSFARTLKDAFPQAEVSASYTGVAADTLSGDWVQL